MSTYQQETKHPETGEWELATWHDDHFGNHNYGVQFPSDAAKADPLERVVYDPREVKLETRETTDDGKEIEHTLHPDGRKDVKIGVRMLDVNEKDPATIKAKEHIEGKIIPELAKRELVITVIHKPTNDSSTFTSNQSNIRANAEVAVAKHAGVSIGALSHSILSEYCLVEHDIKSQQVRVTSL